VNPCLPQQSAGFADHQRIVHTNQSGFPLHRSKVLSEADSPTEMEHKLNDYFTSGVELVWYIDPEKCTVEVFTSPVLKTMLSERGVLDGGIVLPGLAIDLQSFFRHVPREDED
jgi:hypothetical protein